MRFFNGFLAGVGMVLSFGWPKGNTRPSSSSQKAMSGDWQRVGLDMKIALSKYRSENKNDKT